VIDENLMNYVRIELRGALVDRSGKTKGQLQAFSENPLADKKRNPRQSIHNVEIEDGKGGTRQVKAENSAVYVLETRSRRRPLPPITDNDFAAAPWRRAVSALLPHQQAWLRYCYGFDLTFKYQTQICEAVWSELQKKLPTGLLKKTKKRLVSLIWLAVQDVAALHFNDTYQEYAGAELARRLGVSRPTWCEIYRSHWLMMKDAVRVLDELALTAVLENHRDHVFGEVCA